MIFLLVIFLAGLVIYAGYGIPGLCYLLAVTAGGYGLGLLIPRCRWLLYVSVAVNTAALLAVKAQPLLSWDLLIPLGISYFTLQILSYHIDLYRGKYPPERSFLRYGLYITYLPHIFLGPIEPYPKMMAALDSRRLSWDGISLGAARALWGLCKKLIIASRVGVIVSAISADPAACSGPYALIAMVLYSLQLYADFSGGIDCVLGVSRILGLTLSENFDAPYLSQSFQEFWRRWHITLGAWLREYVYIPLGGNRKGKARKFCNLVITFLVSGLWHGIHYLLWGLLNGIFVACGTRFSTKSRHLNRIVTFLLVSLLWSFFIWPDTRTAVTMIGSVFTDFGYGAAIAGIAAMGLTNGDWIVLAVAAAALWVFDCNAAPIREKLGRMCPAGRAAVICLLGLIALVFGMYGLGFNASAFIYSRF